MATAFATLGRTLGCWAAYALLYCVIVGGGYVVAIHVLAWLGGWHARRRWRT